jgi:DNA/RNA-binding domain of Phe-tRNA-synthetase-like protein
MRTISIDEQLKKACPDIHLSCISCSVSVQGFQADLWQLIDAKTREIKENLTIEEIRHNPNIAASREAYKACGKDPARYRLSAEALLRRVVSDKGLYRINNVVDLLNLVSISTGFSIGGYDEDNIAGDIVMGIGQANEPYQALGRGELNIEGMPVFRDEKGAFGTSTSDSERTGVSENTRRFLMVIVSYQSVEKLEETTQMAIQFLTEFAEGKNFETMPVPQSRQAHKERNGIEK